MCFIATAVSKPGPSVVTSQLKLPDKLKPTSQSTTWLAFDCESYKQRQKKYWPIS